MPPIFLLFNSNFSPFISLLLYFHRYITFTKKKFPLISKTSDKHTGKLVRNLSLSYSYGKKNKERERETKKERKHENKVEKHSNR